MAAAALAALLVLAGCGGGAAGTSEDILVIDERFFVARFFDIFSDMERHLGRTIQYEGMFFTRIHDGQVFYTVNRYTMGCCTIDPIGLEVLLNGITPPADNAWVQATGVLEELDGFLVMRITALTEMAERGASFVQ